MLCNEFNEFKEVSHRRSSAVSRRLLRVFLADVPLNKKMRRDKKSRGGTIHDEWAAIRTTFAGRCIRRERFLNRIIGRESERARSGAITGGGQSQEGT